MRIIGLDLGTTTLGIAISDELGIVHLYENFNFEPGNFKKARMHLNDIIIKENVNKIIIGLPLQLDGKEGKRALSTRRFVSDFQKEYGQYNFVYKDERYTTVEANERLVFMGYKKKKIDEMIDAMSAVIILEDYIKEERINDN